MTKKIMATCLMALIVLSLLGLLALLVLHIITIPLAYPLLITLYVLLGVTALSFLILFLFELITIFYSDISVNVEDIVNSSEHEMTLTTNRVMLEDGKSLSHLSTNLI